MLPIEGLSHKRNNAPSAAAEKDGIDRHAVRVLPLRGDHRALAGWRGGAGIWMSRSARGRRSPWPAQPVDQFGGLFGSHLLPPYVAVRSHCAIREDGILRGGEHGIPVRFHARSGSDAKESVLRVDGIEAAVGAELHPSYVVSYGLHFPPRYGRDHHGEVGLAAGRGERASEILGLAGGVGHLEDEHVFRHPAFITGLHRSDAQRVTLLAEQRIATVAGAVGPDLTRFW